MTEYVDRPCLACVVGLFEECRNPREVEDAPGFIIPCGVWLGATTEPARTERGRGLVGRPLSEPDAITDPTSTGRKRAASLHPILDGMVCDWSGLRHAGGGVVPILGCNGNVLKASKGKHEGNVWQGDLHHGPDKNVLNNTPGVNLHAICNQCHKRWHRLNDPYFHEPRPSAGTVWVPEHPYYLHDPMTGFTEDEWRIVEEWWDTPVDDRPDYPFAPPESARLITPVDPSTLSHNPFAPPESTFR